MSEIYRAKTFRQVLDAEEAWLIGRNSAITNFNVGGRTKSVLEANAIIVSRESKDMYVGIRRAIPVAAVEGLGFARKGGLASTGTLEFTRPTPAGVTYPIPAGTQVIFEGKTYETDVAGQITIGNTTSGGIASTCTTVGVAGDQLALAIDTQNGKGSMPSKPDGIFYCKNDTAFTGGEDEESNEKRLQRFKYHINGLPRANPPGILSGVLSVEGVRSASLRESHPKAGWITVYCDDGNGILAPAVKTEVEKVLNGDTLDPENYKGYRAAGIIIQVLAPTVSYQNFTGVVYYLETAKSAPADLITIATSALQASVNSLTLGRDIIRAEVLRAVKASNADIYDFALTSPASNVVIAANELAKTGTVTITASQRTEP